MKYSVGIYHSFKLLSRIWTIFLYLKNLDSESTLKYCKVRVVLLQFVGWKIDISSGLCLMDALAKDFDFTASDEKR